MAWELWVVAGLGSRQEGGPWRMVRAQDQAGV